MNTIQLAISNTAYATALRELLMRSVEPEVWVVEIPDMNLEGVVVLDTRALNCLPSTLIRPERIVLITQNEPHLLAKAWEAGITSVVFENEPISTALLAIMAARLRASKPSRGVATGPGSEAGRHKF